MARAHRSRVRSVGAPSIGTGAILGWIALLASCAGGAATVRPTNLLLVIFDTTRADRLSCYGYAKDTTPHLDEMAERGVRFDAIYAQSSLTPVSAGTLLTGALPFRHGVRSLFVVGKQTVAADVASLPERLGSAGMRTAAFVSAKPMGAHYGLGRAFETYHDDFAGTAERHGSARFGDAPQRPGDETTDLALAWLDEHGGEPFALMVHLFDAHDPSFLPPRDFLDERVDFELPRELGRIGARYRAFFSLENRQQVYDAEIAFMDRQLARLDERLAELGVQDETLAVVIADHGESFGERGVVSHGRLYQEQLHVPVVMRGPGLPAGRVVADRGRLVDVMPTLLELFDIAPPAQALDGESLVPFVAGTGGAASPRDVFAEAHHAADDSHGRDTEMYSLTVGSWKYVHRPATGEHELYDLERDPGELENLYAPDHPEARRLCLRVQAMGAVDGAIPDLESLSEEELDELRGLGYL